MWIHRLWDEPGCTPPTPTILQRYRISVPQCGIVCNQPQRPGALPRVVWCDSSVWACCGSEIYDIVDNQHVIANSWLPSRACPAFLAVPSRACPAFLADPARLAASLWQIERYCRQFQLELWIHWLWDEPGCTPPTPTILQRCRISVPQCGIVCNQPQRPGASQAQSKYGTTWSLTACLWCDHLCTVSASCFPDLLGGTARNLRRPACNTATPAPPCRNGPGPCRPKCTDTPALTQPL